MSGSPSSAPAPGAMPPGGAPAPGGVPPPGAPNPLMMPPPGGWLDLSKEPLTTRANLLVGPVTSFYILALVFVGLRIWSKHIKKASYRLSDYAVFIATIFGTGYLAICWLAVEEGGVGHEILRVAPSARLITRKAFFAGWLLQCYANTFVRLSILDFIMQVFHHIKKFRSFVYIMEGAVLAYMAGCTIAWFATCRPMKYNWELGPTVLQHCGDLKMKFLLSSIFNLVLDVCILVLPMPMLWTLQMSTRKKIALSVVFGLGIFVCFATAWRTYHVVKFSNPKAQMNFTISIVEDALWSGLEITLGIVNACLPVTPPAFQRLLNLQFFRMLTFSSFRTPKASKMSSTGNSSISNGSRTKRSWVRLGNTKEESKTGISRAVEYSVDIESGSNHNIPMENMGSTTNLAANAGPQHNPLTNQYYTRKSDF